MDKPALIEACSARPDHFSLRTELKLNAWLAVATVLYLVGLLLTKHHPEWTPLTRGLLLLTPLLPGLLYMRSWMRLVRAMDEMQRLIQMEAFLFAAVGTIAFVLVVDTLGSNGVALGLLKDGMSLGVTFTLMCVLQPIGRALASHRYR